MRVTRGVDDYHWSKPRKTREAYRYDSDTHDGANGNKARQAYFVRHLCFIQVPLRGRAGARSGSVRTLPPSVFTSS